MTPGHDFSLTGKRNASVGRQLPGGNDWATLVNMVRGLKSTDGRTLIVTHMPTGISLTVRPATPFLGQVNPSDGAQIVVGYGRAESGYAYRDTITWGVDRLQKSMSESVTVSATSFVYYVITKSGTTITATLTANATYPTDTSTTFNVVLGKAVWDTDHISRWYQYHYGDITTGTASGGGMIPGVITSHTSGRTYACSLYANGSDTTATSTGVSVYIGNVSASETLANGTAIMVTQVGDGGYEGYTAGVLV